MATLCQVTATKTGSGLSPFVHFCLKDSRRCNITMSLQPYHTRVIEYIFLLLTQS